MFSKSAVNGIHKWQICFCFRCFHAFIRRKREIPKRFTLSFRWIGKRNNVFTTLSRFFNKILTLSNQKTIFHCTRLIGFFV